MSTQTLATPPQSSPTSAVAKKQPQRSQMRMRMRSGCRTADRRDRALPCTRPRAADRIAADRDKGRPLVIIGLYAREIALDQLGSGERSHPMVGVGVVDRASSRIKGAAWAGLSEERATTAIRSGEGSLSFGQVG
jgi:hypothetical protein